ncbi:MAG: hypothetical protein WDN04_23170 [Rhodospirillales bacterium]
MLLLAAGLTYHLQLRVLGAFFGWDAVLRCGSEFLLGAAAGTSPAECRACRRQPPECWKLPPSRP